MTMKTSGNNITIPVQDISIVYNDWGNSNVPLIFIHGFPFNKSTWDKQLEYLQQFTRVIAYDVRGFGQSSNNTDECSITMFADDLIDFMDALQIDRAIVCGLSMGGYIILNAISRYKHRFAGIILCDTQCIADTNAVREKRYATIEQIKQEGTENYALAFVKNMFTNQSVEQHKPFVAEIKNSITANKSSSIISGLKALANRAATCSELGDIDIPTLIICGKEDMVTPIAQSIFLQENIPNAKLVLIDNAAHLSNIEQPEIFNNTLLDFIQKV